MAYNEEEFLQLSGLQHFRFCRRRWALIHIEHQWAENYRTMIFGKLSNGAASIQRTLRDHAPRVADCGLEKAAACRRSSSPSWILRKTVCAFTIWGSNMRKKWSISVRRAPICQRIP